MPQKRRIPPPCDEYKKLDLVHQAAEHQVWRYKNPDKEPPMARLNASQVRKLLANARAEETKTRLAMQEHLKTCKVCGQSTDGKQVPNP